MAAYNGAKSSGVYATMRSVFKTLREDSLLCKYLYYPSTGVNDDPSTKQEVTSAQKDEIVFITTETDELEGSGQIKRGRLSFGLGNIQKSFKNPMSSKPVINIFIYIPREGFQNVDFRLEAIIDRIDEILSGRVFDGSFGRISKDNGTPREAPKGYLGYLIRYDFIDMVF